MKLRHFYIGSSAILIYIILISLFISQLMQTALISLDPTLPMNQVSALAFGQMIFWIFGLISIAISLVLLWKKNFSLIHVIRFNLISLIGIISGVITGSAFLALNGTQFYFGLLGGDLGVHLKHAQNALEFGWDKSGYPPLWSTIVGNISNFFNLDVYVSHKFISIHFIVVWIAGTYLIIRIAFPAILAEFLALSYTFSMAINGWKTAGEVWTQILLLALIKIIFELHTGKFVKTVKTRMHLAFLGLLFGCSIILYYGRLWWIGFAIATAILITNFFKDKNNLVRPSILDFFLAALLPLLPTFLLMRGDKFGLNVNQDLHKLLIAWFLISGLWYLPILPKILLRTFSRVFTIIFPIVIFFLFPSFSIGDTFSDEGKMFQNNIAPSFSLQPALVFFLIFVFGSVVAFILNEKTALTYQLIFLMMSMISALLMMYFYAFEMYKTKAIELFPRASFAIGDNWNLQLLIYSFLIGSFIFEKFQEQILKKIRENPITILFGFGASLLALMAYFSNDLAAVQWALFPRPQNEAYFAWISSGWVPK